MRALIRLLNAWLSPRRGDDFGLLLLQDLGLER
jgi:hypothetical protein